MAQVVSTNTQTSSCDKLDFDNLLNMLLKSRQLIVLFEEKDVGTVEEPVYVTLEPSDIETLTRIVPLMKYLTNSKGEIVPDKTLTLSKHANELNIVYHENGELKPGCVKLTGINEAIPVRLGGKTRLRKRTYKRKRSKNQERPRVENNRHRNSLCPM